MHVLVVCIRKGSTFLTDQHVYFVTSPCIILTTLVGSISSNILFVFCVQVIIVYILMTTVFDKVVILQAQSTVPWSALGLKGKQSQSVLLSILKCKNISHDNI